MRRSPASIRIWASKTTSHYSSAHSILSNTTVPTLLKIRRKEEQNNRRRKRVWRRKPAKEQESRVLVWARRLTTWRREEPAACPNEPARHYAFGASSRCVDHFPLFPTSKALSWGPSDFEVYNPNCSGCLVRKVEHTWITISTPRSLPASKLSCFWRSHWLY